ncbi:hypothetical protein BKA70DRAFT_1559318 [Coprinopsis sp. MPI-PUGE-AT-0042]|nr:hypothetical protein BKA70DRAFT_1559318 [Coprinopsis sp. MPI-PUGE-AT-0042]
MVMEPFIGLRYTVGTDCSGPFRQAGHQLRISGECGCLPIPLVLHYFDLFSTLRLRPALTEEGMDVVQVFGVYRQGLYSHAAALTYIVCDIVGHLPDEVELIWRRKNWDAVKVMYFIGRYFGPLYILSLLIINSLPVSYEVCKNFFFLYGSICGGIIASVLINSIFFLRMYALYGRTPRALISWAAFILVIIGLESYGTAWSAIRAVQHVMPAPFPEWTGCTTAPMPYTGNLYACIPSILGGLVYFVATARKLKEHSQEYPTITSIEAKYIQRISPLSAALFQDGAFWFLLITLLSALCIWGANFEHGLYIVHVTAWIHTVYSCCASHIILNLRKIARLPEGNSISRGNRSWMEPIQFAEMPVPPNSYADTGESSTRHDSLRGNVGSSTETRS